MKRKSLLYIAIVGIFIIALILRTVYLSAIPNGLHVDELDAGYIGRYILEHGKDITGRFFPFYYNKFGDYRPTGMFYLTGLSVKLFGATIAAIRLPGALLGSFTVLAIMGLSYVLFGNVLASVASGFFLAITPWHIVLSRATSEGIAGLFFLVAGLTIIIYGLKRNFTSLLIFGSLVMVISYLFYHPFRLLTPFILLPLLTYPLVKKKEKWYIGIILFSFFLITILVSVTGTGSRRFSQVAFYSNPLLNNKTEEMLASEGSGNVFRARVFHNKVVIFTREFIVQYFKYFSLEFLLINGGLPDRYRVPEQGLLFIVFLPLMVASYFYLIRDKRMWSLLFIMCLLLIAPLAAALTFEDTPNVHRSLIMIIPFILLSGYGASSLYRLLRFKYIKFGFIATTGVILLMEFNYFWHQYTIHSMAHIPMYRNDRFFELARYLAKSDFPYDGVYIPGYEHLPLYVLFAAGDFQTQPFTQDSNDVLLEKFNKIHFVHSWCPTKTINEANIPQNILLIEIGDCKTNGNYRELSVWKRRDATTAFRMIEPR